MNCPLCNEEIQIEFSEYPQGDDNIYCCDNCERRFTWRWEASVDIYTDKIPEVTS